MLASVRFAISGGEKGAWLLSVLDPSFRYGFVSLRLSLANRLSLAKVAIDLYCTGSSTTRELVLGAIASFLLSGGVLYALLWSGVML
jgi:hypothetical protein